MAQKYYGYLRDVATGLEAEEQREQLLRWGIVEKHLYADLVGETEESFPAFRRLMKTVHEGDVLVVPSLDRLGSSYEEIQRVWAYLIKERHLDLVILDIPILDTRTNKALLGSLMTDIVLQLFEYIAQRENNLARLRQAEGIAMARAKGVHLGRPPRPTPEGFEDYYALWRAKQLSFTEFARKIDVTETQLKWLVRKKRKETAAR